MDFKDVKQFIIDSIDDADTIADLFRLVLNKAYEKGYDDGETHGVEMSVQNNSYPVC